MSGKRIAMNSEWGIRPVAHLLHNFPYPLSFSSLNKYSVHGPVINPFGESEGRSAGGSSGGSAAAVAAGLCDASVSTFSNGIHVDLISFSTARLVLTLVVRSAFRRRIAE